MTTSNSTDLTDKQEPPVPSAGNDSLRWYVLTTLSPKQAEQQLITTNEERALATDGRQIFQYFIPYLFLKRRIGYETTSDLNENDDVAPRSKAQARANNEARSALRRFIFVRAREREITGYLSSDQNRWSPNRLQFYLDRQRRKVTVTDRMMSMFIEACSDMQLHFEMGSPVDDITTGEEVVLCSTPFRGEKAYVMEARHTDSGLRLTLGLNMFAGTMSLRLTDITESDILRTHEGAVIIDDSHLIDNTQRQLLAILGRRVDGRQDEETRRQDNEVLDRLFNYRYHSIPSPSARRHFLALQLICARLRHDTASQEELTRQALTELALINERPETKAATDVRAYLQAALYLSTGDPTYREAAKIYIRDHAPKSKALRRLVKLIRTKRV